MPGIERKLNTPALWLAGLLVAVLPASGYTADTADGLGATSAATNATISSYESSLEQIESRQGAYGADLTEPLFGLALALQSAGSHGEAITLFKRGIHLNRVNHGLYSDTQIPLIQAEIKSHIAQGNYTTADDRQAYLYRVQMHVAGEDGPRARVYLQQAEWQYQAYRAGKGQSDYTRLMNMWDLYRAALTETAEREGNVSPNLMPPLEGMLQTLYLMADYQFPKQSMGSDEDIARRVSLNRFTAYRAQSYDRGSTVIATMRELEMNNDNPETAAHTLVMLGDWQLWHGNKQAAFSAYSEAYGELASLPAAENTEALTALAAPVALPNFADLQPLPQATTPEQGNILLEFGVSVSGKVVDLQRLDDNEALDGKASRLMRTLRRTTFRPKFEAGQAVASEKITRAFRL